MSRELFRAATDYARDVTSGLTDDALGLSTPCDDWDTRAVVLHLADVAASLVDLIEGGELRMPGAPTGGATDPVATLTASLDRLEAALSTAADPDRARAAMQAGAIELTVHGWDIAVASSPGHTVPEQLAADVLQLATSLIADSERAPRFAPRIDAPPTASTSDRLTAFFGRGPIGRP